MYRHVYNKGVTGGTEGDILGKLPNLHPLSEAARSFDFSNGAVSPNKVGNWS